MAAVFVFQPSSNQANFCNTSNQGGCCNPSLDFPNRTSYEIGLVSIGRYGPSLFIHTKMSTIGEGVT